MRGAKRSLIFFVCLSVHLGLHGSIAAQKRAWIARHPGGSATAIGLDSDGNLYVTGTSGTVKYDADGHPAGAGLWPVPGPGAALAIDVDGNVYITGSFDGDYATRKYDSQGNERWARFYDGPGSGDDAPAAVAADPAGNVYVTGRSPGSGTDFDYATVKYDADGNVSWARRYDGPGSGDDEARAMAVDSAGNVYVTGSSMGSETDFDYATVKYGSDGDQLWVRRYGGPGSGDDEARAMAVDSAGSVYVTGWSLGSGTSSDYATVKYGSDGDLLWVRRYNGPASDSDAAWALALDGDANVCVTGQSRGLETDNDYATVKYSSGGDQLWVARYHGFYAAGRDYASALAVNHTGDIYVTGESQGPYGTGYDFATVKYDSDGNEVWVARYAGPGGPRLDHCEGEDRPAGLAVDAAGNVHVAGGSDRRRGPGCDMNYVTVKYVPGDPEFFLTGDANLDGKLDISDAQFILNYYFFGSNLLSSDCPSVADLNNDARVDVPDPLFLLVYLFFGGEGPIPGSDLKYCDIYDPAPPEKLADFTLGFEGCPIAVPGGPGEMKIFEVFATLTTANNSTVGNKNIGEQGAEAWSISLGVEGPLRIIDITTTGTVGCHANLGPPCMGEGLENSQLTAGDGNGGAVSAVLLSTGPTQVTLPPSGTARIARLTVEATFSGEESTDAGRIFYVDSRQGSGRAVENVVSLRGMSHKPALGSCTVLLRPGGGQIPGNCNSADDFLDLSDAVCIFGVLFLGTPSRFPCGDGSPGDPGNIALLDWQPDGQVDLSDGVALLQFLFLGGPAHPLAVSGSETEACVGIAGCEDNPSCS